MCVHHLAALRVLQEAKAHRVAAFRQNITALQEHSDGMAAADRVVVPLHVLVERLRLERLYQVHSRLVQLLDRLVDGAARAFAVRVPEALAPMAEVGGDHEEVLRVGQVRSEDLAELPFRLEGQRADHDGDDSELVAKVLHHLGDERQLHLDAVLVLVRLQVHPLELVSLAEFPVDRLVHLQVVQRRLVDLALGECTGLQSDVVRGAQDENALHHRRTDLTEAPTCAVAAVGVASVTKGRGER